MGGRPIAEAAVRQLDRAINILDHQNGAIPGGQQQLPEIGILHHIGELQIINIKLQVIGHGRNQAGFAGPRRAVEQIAPLPRPPHPLVKLLPLDEPVQILHHRPLQLRLHRHRLERRRMLQIDGLPLPAVAAGAAHGVHFESPGFVLDGGGAIEEVGDVGSEDFLVVGFVELELEVAALCSAARKQSVVVGGVAGFVVFVGIEGPQELDAVEGIHQFLALFEAEGGGFVFGGFGDAEARGGRSDFRRQVRLGGVVDLVGGHAGGFFDQEGQERGGGIEEAADSGGDVRPDRAGDQVVGH